ncbi:hypothetical protein CRUP_009647, partial [Coryphaenoides rupestris]
MRAVGSELQRRSSGNHGHLPAHNELGPRFRNPYDRSDRVADHFPARLVSLCTLTLLAYERYNVVCRPQAAFKLNMRRSRRGLLFVWVFCLAWAVAPLLGWSSYGPEGVQTSCSLGWEERSWSNYSYLVLYTLLCFVAPVIVILNHSVELQGGRSSLEENERAIRMVLFMIVAFFVCWLPYTVLSVVVVADPQLHIPPLLATMPMYFAKTSPVYNPVIYFLSNKELNHSVELQGGRSSLEENERAIRMVLFMIVAFFVCWLPYTVLSVVVVADPQLHIPPLLATMPMYFAKTSPVYNPVIYFLSNKEFRDAALELLSCGRYIPHGPSASGLAMRSLHHRNTSAHHNKQEERRGDEASDEALEPALFIMEISMQLVWN